MQKLNNILLPILIFILLQSFSIAAEPTNLPKWDENNTNVIPISTELQDDGFALKNKPASGTFNSWFRNVYKWTEWFQEKFGVVDTEITKLAPVGTIAELRSLTYIPSDGQEISVLGYATIGDGGGGPIRYWASGEAPGTYVDNGSSIIVPTVGDGSAAWLWPAQPRVNVDWFGAFGNGNGDIVSPTGNIDDDFIEAAIAYFDGLLGVVEFSNKFYRINHIEIDQRVILQGTSSRIESLDSRRWGTTLQVHNTVTTLAVKLVNHSCGLKNIAILGETGNTADGVQFMGNSDFIESVSIFNMGGNGIVVGHPTENGNRNGWRISDSVSRSNLGHGCVIDDYNPGGGPDANAGNTFMLLCQLNGGDGLRINSAAVNTFHGLKTESNTGVGIRVMSSARNNCFLSPHSEGNTAGDFVYDSGSTNNFVLGSYDFSPIDNGSNGSMKYGGGSAQNISFNLRNFLINHESARYTSTLNASIGIEGTSPGTYIYESDGATDSKLWAWVMSGGILRLRAVSDDGTTNEELISISRSGTTIGNMSIPNGKLLVTEGIGVGNSVSGDITSGGTASSTRNFPVFDTAGGIIGYVPLY